MHMHAAGTGTRAGGVTGWLPSDGNNGRVTTAVCQASSHFFFWPTSVMSHES